MKLRNKKTGEIWDIGKVLTNDYPSYDTLEQITEDFEDCDGNLRVINKNDTSKEGEYGSIKAFLEEFEDAEE